MLERIRKIAKNTDNFIVLVIVLVMLNNIEHLSYVHHIIARQVFPTERLNWWHSIVVVVIIELSIIVLVRKGQYTFALVYTLCLFALSLIYYPLDEYLENAQYGRFIAAIIYSLMFTISIYYFAVMAAQNSNENSKLLARTRELDETCAELHQVRAKLHETGATLMQSEVNYKNLEEDYNKISKQLCSDAATIDELKRQLHQTKQELQQLVIYRQQIEAACTCKHCGIRFESEASKRSHEGRCKGKEVKEAA